MNTDENLSYLCPSCLHLWRQLFPRLRSTYPAISVDGPASRPYIVFDEIKGDEIKGDTHLLWRKQRGRNHRGRNQRGHSPFVVPQVQMVSVPFAFSHDSCPPIPRLVIRPSAARCTFADVMPTTPGLVGRVGHGDRKACRRGHVVHPAGRLAGLEHHQSLFRIGRGVFGQPVVDGLPVRRQRHERVDRRGRIEDT
jgi:hypothetical protein